MSLFVTQCPHCGYRFNLETGLVGQVVGCRHCQQPFRAAEYAPHLQQYRDERRKAPDPDKDDIVAPPVRTPSWRETPILRTTSPTKSGVPVAPSARAVEASVHAEEFVDEANDLSHRGLRLAALLHTYGGSLAIVFGLIVFSIGLTSRSTSGSSMAGSDGRLLIGWGIGLVLYGGLAVALGHIFKLLRRVLVRGPHVGA